MNDSSMELIEEVRIPIKLKKPIVIKYPKREPSLAPLRRPVIYYTPEKITCSECPCFPRTPYIKRPKLRSCFQSPPMLYELASAVVDSLMFPEAFRWSTRSVATWMSQIVGLPQYEECILDNNVDGKRLLLFEDISHLPKINIQNFEHIKKISLHIRKLYSVEFIRFSRSIGLPARLPLTCCALFSSRSGPSWGIRQNWTNTDILRHMQIINPEPLHLDHWDLVWYEKPQFPRTLFARTTQRDRVKRHYKKRENLPIYRQPSVEVCNEITIARKFRMNPELPEERQKIWMERVPGDPLRNVPVPTAFITSATRLTPEKRKMKEDVRIIPKIKENSRLLRKKIDLKGLSGKDLILAKRVMPKQKFIRSLPSDFNEEMSN